MPDRMMGKARRTGRARAPAVAPRDAAPSPAGDSVDTSKPGLRIYCRLAREAPSGPADWPHHAAMALLSGPLDEAVADILAHLGKSSGADRAWLLEYNDSLTLFRNTHEWCRPGVSSHVEDLQDIPVTMIGEMQPFMAAGRPVMVTDVDAMPRSMRGMQVEFRRQGIRSTLTVPIHIDGRLRGAVGLDRTRRSGAWPDEAVPALRRVGEILGQAREGQRLGSGYRQAGGQSFPGLFYLHASRGILGVPLESFVLLRAERDYTRVHLSDGTTVTDSRPLKWWQGVLPTAHFFRLHRSRIVQVGRIVELIRKPGGDLQVLLDGVDEPVGVARTAAAELRSRLGY